MNIIDLINTPQKDLLLSDQQIQQLTLEEVHQRHLMLQETLSGVLDYDIVISDTNVWLELNAASHSDNRGNTRLMFERQLDFMSKMMRHRGGKFIIMGETYEEIDRFAAVQDPVNHKEADFSDNLVYLNAAARLAKRLILSMQRENRLRIEGISSESHHAAFADPAIVRRVVELFTEGKKVLLLTNDASVAIRSIALCDDLQRINAVSDEEWNATYALLRPMAFTFDDLRLLDNYTRQYHYIQMADGTPWMTEVQPYSLSEPRCSQALAKLTIDEYAFRQGDKHRGDNLFIKAEEQPERKQEKKQQQQQAQQKKQQGQQQKQQSQQQKQQQSKPQEKQQGQSQQQRKQQGKQQQGQQEKQPQLGSQSQPQGTPDASKATVPDGSPSGLTPEHPASASQQDADAAATTKKPQRRTSARRTSKKTAETSADVAMQQPQAPLDASKAAVADGSPSEPTPERSVSASPQDADAATTKKPQRRTSTRKATKKTADDVSKPSEDAAVAAQSSDATTKSATATKEAAATKGATTKSATVARTKAKSSATEKKTKSSGIKKTVRKKPAAKK